MATQRRGFEMPVAGMRPSWRIDVKRRKTCFKYM
jgi:hypothetical protein